MMVGNPLMFSQFMPLLAPVDFNGPQEQHLKKLLEECGLKFESDEEFAEAAQEIGLALRYRTRSRVISLRPDVPVGRRIAIARCTHQPRLSQKALVEQVNAVLALSGETITDRSALSRIETGEQSATYLQVAGIAQVLNLPLTAFLPTYIERAKENAAPDAEAVA